METTVVLVTFFGFYMLPCFALIVMLLIDSRPGSNRPRGERVNSPAQARDLPSPTSMTESNQLQTRVPPAPIPIVEPNQPQARALPATKSNTESKPESTSVKGRILLAYASGLEAIEKAGVIIAPNKTLRESLTIAASMPPATNKPFVELTTLAEIALYSTRKMDENMAIRAEQLAATIK